MAFSHPISNPASSRKATEHKKVCTPSLNEQLPDLIGPVRPQPIEHHHHLPLTKRRCQEVLHDVGFETLGVNYSSKI